MTTEEIKNCLRYLVALYPRFELTEERVAAFADHFGEQSTEEMKTAIDAFCKTSSAPWPPSFSELHGELAKQRQENARLAREALQRKTLERDKARERKALSESSGKTAAEVIESCRPALRKLYGEPIPKVIEDDEIVSGCDDQRVIYKSEVMP